MDEDLAGEEADDLVGGHAGVGAADPEILGVLLAGELGEELGIALRDFGGPALVLNEEIGEVRHGGGQCAGDGARAKEKVFGGRTRASPRRHRRGTGSRPT